MSSVVTTRSGKTIETKNGVTTITKYVNGQKIVKTYNVNNTKAGNFVAQAGNVGITEDTVHIEGQPNNGKLGAQAFPPPAAGDAVPPQQQPQGPVQAPRAGRVLNQFNITGTQIGQMAIGNKGPTNFNTEVKKFEAGASNAEYNISGGNFAQSNIGGQAVFNNQKSGITAGGGGGLSMDLLKTRTGHEEYVLALLKKGLSAEKLLKLLQKGYGVKMIHEHIVGFKGRAEIMADSMLNSDPKDLN